MNVWNYTFIAVTMMIFMQFAGVPTGLNSVFEFAGLDFNPDNSLSEFSFQISNFWEYIFNDTTGLLATLLGTGVAVGLFVSGRADIAIFAGIASAVFVLFIPILTFFVNYALANDFSAWSTGVLAMVFVPLTVGYVVSLFKYIGGGQ